MKAKTMPIKISDKNRIKLIKWKYDLGLKSIDNVLSQIFEVVSKIDLASNIKKEVKTKNGK